MLVSFISRVSNGLDKSLIDVFNALERLESKAEGPTKGLGGLCRPGLLSSWWRGRAGGTVSLQKLSREDFRLSPTRKPRGR